MLSSHLRTTQFNHRNLLGIEYRPLSFGKYLCDSFFPAAQRHGQVIGKKLRVVFQTNSSYHSNHPHHPNNRIHPKYPKHPEHPEHPDHPAL